MTKGDTNTPMAHQSKKKRTDEEPLTPDAGQKPIQLQRRRVWRACESCRRKKIKCDGCEPTCSQCSTSGSQCTWLQTKDRAALSRHYVQELEARLLHMESLFKQVAPVLEQIGTSTNSAASSPSDTTAMVPVLDPSKTDAAAAILRSIAPVQRPLEPASPVKIEDDVSESFGQLALDEYGHMRWMGGSSSMSLIQSFRALTTSPLHRISPAEEDPQAPGPSINKLYFPASVFFGKVHALPGPEEVEYPERDLADKLVEAYFARLHFLMPVIDKPSFLLQYTNVMNNTHDRNLARSQTAFISLIFAVFACAANIVQDPRLSTSERHDDGGMGMVYYERALILQYISHASIQVAHVQCFILLSSFLCSVNCLPQAWILVGQAVRTGQDLGLHRSPRRLILTPIEKETRRKIWWGVYTLDRMLALALGRPLGISDSDCDVEYPCEVDDDYLVEYFKGAVFNQPFLMTGTVALTKLYEITGRVLRQVYSLDNCRESLELERKAELESAVESLHAELTQWCDDLPAMLKRDSKTPEQSAMAAVLCSHYYSVLTTLHRNLLPVNREDPSTKKSASQGVSSARSCIQLSPSIRNVVPPSHHLAFFIQHLFGSAVIVLLYAMHASETKASTQAIEEAKTALVAIESWEGTWPGARKCKELLAELIATATDAVAKGTNSDSNPSPPAAPHSPTPQRRRSVTIATVAPNTIPGRMLKSKNTSRRNRSREQSGARRLAASPYHVDTALRARSTSRKRGHDDPEDGSYYQSFTSPTLAPSNNSSPSSMGVPSPAMSSSGLLQDNSPTLASTSAYSYPGTSTQPPASPLYEFDYGLSPNPLGQGTSQQWSNSGGSSGLDIYSADGTMTYESPYGAYPAGLDSVYSGYEPSNGIESMGLSTTPPTASFNASGLPFRGLEFIRNFNNSGGYSMDQDPLWQSYDPIDFDYSPDLPFTLGDSDIQT
ncbi:fungal-specific transcription factor domain-containing protein [Desarmillaria ectypa]|nr:fungal-specific transcription factor domain-containing protein [Desarmillaria ectypa]